MRIFFVALKITMAIMSSVVFVSAGAYLSFTFYFTNQTIDPMFAVVGPAFLFVAGAMVFLAIEEIKHEGL
jgi:hypothetical protein